MPAISPCRFAAIAICCSLCGAAAVQARAESPPIAISVNKVAKGKSDKTTQATAKRQILSRRLNQADLAVVNRVLTKTGLFRRMPVCAFPAETDVYRYFVSKPEMAVALWKAMGISKFKLTRTGKTTWKCDAGDGSTGTMRILSRDGNHILLHCTGKLTGPLLVRPVTTEALVHLQVRAYRDRRKQLAISHQADIFARFPSRTVTTAVQLFSPLTNRIIDKNFEEVSLFVHLLSQAMKTRPAWVLQFANKMEITKPQRAEFVKLTKDVYRRFKPARISAKPKSPVQQVGGSLGQPKK